ncbi:radical SAM protein [Desulfotalea psychrophila]|uniref:Radical SAM protein n=1 Tax=Desulfotalea psychrophila TaxID=84980 RepID=A0ABS3AVI5_9BACT|nr:radical SAM protein [Desulfotalea psychrophila]
MTGSSLDTNSHQTEKYPYKYYRYYPSKEFSNNSIRNILLISPHEICFEITNKCNLFCPVCIANSSCHNKTFLSASLIKSKILNLPPNIQRITLTGGEPTLHSEISNILDMSTQKCATILSTNGYYPDKIYNLTKNKKNLIVAISLHGPQKIHDEYVGKKGSFQKALESINISIQNGVYTHVYTTISSYNLHHLKELTNILNTLQIVEHRINVIKNKGRINTIPVTIESIYGIVETNKHTNTVTIKDEEQPFLFINCNGETELKNGQ